MKSLPLFTLILSYISYMINCAAFTQYEEIKVFTCLTLAKQILEAKDKAKMKEKTLKQMFYYNSTASFEELEEQLRVYIILNCFNTISTSQLTMLHEKVEKKFPMNLKDESIESLVSYQYVADMFKRNNTAEIEKKIKEVEVFLKRVEQKQAEEAEASFNDLSKNPGLFGIGFKQIDKAKLTAIGYGMIVLLLGILAYVAYRLLKKKEKPKKKKK